jgi:hypothetical protein
MKVLLILIPLVLAFSAWSQEPSSGDSSAACITYWKQGQTHIYTILHEKRNPQPNMPDTVFHFSYEATVSVLDASDSDYTVKWIFHIPPGINAGPQDTLPFFEGMQIIYRISNEGAFLGLLNWEEVRDHYSEIMNFPKGSFDTREKVESALIREVQLYHLPFGYKFTTTKVSSPTHLSNPFGGSPLPAIQSFQVTTHDPLQFTLVIEQNIDTATLSSTMGTRLKKITDVRERQIKKEQFTSLELSDYSEYRVIRYTGWIKHLYYKRAAVGGGITQSDAYTIDMKN